MVPATRPVTIAIRTLLNRSERRRCPTVAHRYQASAARPHATETFRQRSSDVFHRIQVRQRIVTDEYHIEARRPHWQRPEVGDQTDEREATHRRLSSGAGYGPDGDIRAGNAEAVREQPERLRAMPSAASSTVCAPGPMLGNERSEHLTLTTDARFPILVDEVIQRCQSVVERLDCHSIT